MEQTHRRSWLVLKFGGTSVSSDDCWKTIVARARQGVKDGQAVMIVVSALSGVTNLLTRMAAGMDAADRQRILDELDQKHQQLFNALGLKPGGRFLEHWNSLHAVVKQLSTPCNPESFANLLAHGELLSSSIGQQILTSFGVDTTWQDARGLLTAMPDTLPGEWLSVRCDDRPDPGLAERLSSKVLVHITQGFIASGPGGMTCLLGRGGSDTSAAYLAARLQADALEIWTDVPGIFSADPRVVPEARLLKQLSYSEAQEMASMGAKVLHPPSIQPARRQSIPVYIRDTNRPAEDGTRIGEHGSAADAQVKGVVSRSEITLISMENPSMWRQAGFLADAFAVFKRHGYSVDLISTSESTVTVSLDSQASTTLDSSRMTAFLEDLAALCQVEVRSGCVSISLVGNAIRTILGRLSAALDVFQDRHIHMVTQSANDLNLTLVVDPEHAVSLVRKLHQSLIASQADSRPEFGPSWVELTRASAPADQPQSWWKTEAPRLVGLMKGRKSAYVYHLDTARAAARRLLGLKSVERVLYAVKANDHKALLRTFASEALGFECVSMNEVRHVLKTVQGLQPRNILFTPNFAPRDEYQAALKAGLQLTVDNSWAIHQWPELFAGRDIFLRLDLETGYGHHRKVITSGADSKFGISLQHMEALRDVLERNGTRVTGLHAHTGSGVIDARVWGEQLDRLLDAAAGFPDVRVLDLGGGFGVPERSSQPVFDLPALDRLLAAKMADSGLEIWLEPGRYLAADCGVLLARVTQLKTKGQYDYLGIATGMNSLIRPALYGSYHEIVNLDRMDEAAVRNYRVVGPICESGDVIGESRLLPESMAGDILLIANAGAYGRVMASHYNRRPPAIELTL
ncbi:MAG: bifunctional aspartate kinase/diaminopimelate decarboxylase [Xanthomonadales bacterium]|nr:bifunctional aspartate kinase/diaminopimelate decarboxylase [Xanthomonadales bacterium]